MDTWIGTPTPENREFSSSIFVAKLEQRWQQGHFVCVGLDTEWVRIPHSIKAQFTSVGEQMFSFNREIIDATAELVCAYKPNAAFYEAEGTAGLEALYETVAYVKRSHPNIPVILDAKRADIGSTNNGYVKAAFDELGVDAITVHPYLGREAMKPFLNRTDKGVIVLIRSSNPGAGEFQDLRVTDKQEPLYQVIARSVADTWNENGNCAVVVGATYPQELATVRSIVGDMPILIPGIGAQGGEIEATVRAGKDSRSMGMIINSSRGIIFASGGPDFAHAARTATERLGEDINKSMSSL